MIERDKQIEELFQSVLDQPIQQREKFLRKQASRDSELLEQVTSLLDHYAIAQKTFLSNPIHELLDPTAKETELPSQIGKYKILDKLGEGGMGVVYRAQQENPLREVAVKLIRSEINGPDTIRRFEFEASVLGRLQHPNIAHILEAGMYNDGKNNRPFFAMELVVGTQLISFANDANLDTHKRLELFISICQAVHHAHQKGIIHRDLKPANILVTSDNDRSSADNLHATSAITATTAPVPKILDFGVARSMNAETNVTTFHTSAGQLVGTLAYMSPEQLESDSHLDTRSDNYALGVILYELLVGRLPFDVKDTTLANAARIISEQDPQPLSTIDRTLRGDLNTIVMKALEKDPAHRYQTALDLSSDLRRFISNKPITARPMTTMYQARKFAKRNRGLIAGLSCAIVILIAGVIVSLFFAIGQSRALAESGRQQRITQTALEESKRQQRIAQAVNDFLNKDILANASPKNEPNRSVSLREVLDRAADSISTRFTDEPFVEARIRTTLADTYKSLGEYEIAKTHAEIAVERLKQSGSEFEREMLFAINRLASLEQHVGNSEKAEKLFRSALDKAKPKYGEDDSLTLAIMNNLALLLNKMDRHDESVTLLEMIVEKRTRILGEKHPHTMTSLNNLALAYLSLKRYDDAQRIHLKEANLSSEILGPEHPDTLISFNNLAVAYSRNEDYDKAEKVVREVLEARKRVLGPFHPVTIESMDTLATILFNKKNYDAATALFQEILEIANEKFGTDHSTTLFARYRLASIYFVSKKFSLAESVTISYYADVLRIRGRDHRSTALAMILLCETYIELEKYDEAQTLGVQCIEVFENTFGPKHPETIRTKKILHDLEDLISKL